MVNNAAGNDKLIAALYNFDYFHLERELSHKTFIAKNILGCNDLLSTYMMIVHEV